MGSNRIAICDGCGKEEKIVKGWTTRAAKFCMNCKLKQDRDKKKPFVSKKVTERQLSKYRMDDLINREIWHERKRECVECGSPLISPPVKSYFSHLLSKGAHPELRFDKENIVLHCRGCHNKWEFAAGFREKSNTLEKHRGYLSRHSSKFAQ